MARYIIFIFMLITPIIIVSCSKDSNLLVPEQNDKKLEDSAGAIKGDYGSASPNGSPATPPSEQSAAPNGSVGASP